MDGFVMRGVIDVLPKNQAERFLIALDEWQGHNLVNLRIGLVCRGGERKLTKEGLSIPAAHLPRVIKGLEKAKQEAIARGWLDAA